MIINKFSYSYAFADAKIEEFLINFFNDSTVQQDIKVIMLTDIILIEY